MGWIFNPTGRQRFHLGFFPWWKRFLPGRKQTSTWIHPSRTLEFAHPWCRCFNCESNILYRFCCLCAGCPLARTVSRTLGVRAKCGCTCAAASAVRSFQGLHLLGSAPLPPPAVLLLHKDIGASNKSTMGEVTKSSSVQVAKRNICLSNLLHRVPKMAPNSCRWCDSSSHSLKCVGDTLSNQMKDKNKPPRRREDSGLLCFQWFCFFYIPSCLKFSSMLPQEFLVMKVLTRPHGCFLYFTLV